MIYLRTDQYTRVSRECPVSIDMYPADDIIEVTLGENRFGGDTLRLIVDHPDTCLRLVAALHDAHLKLMDHLRAKASPDPAMSRLDGQREDQWPTMSSAHWATAR